jgi:hypothetical protein
VTYRRWVPIASTYSAVLDRQRLVGPIFVLSAMWLSSLILLLLGGPTFIHAIETGKIPGPSGVMLFLACVAVAVTMPWYVGRAMATFAKPDRLEINPDGITVEHFGRTLRYGWSELGEPRRKTISSKVLAIEIPRAGKSKGLVIRTGLYDRPFDEVLSAILRARDGAESFSDSGKLAI